MADAIISQAVAETLVAPAAAGATVSQEIIETLVAPAAAGATVSQEIIETLVAPRFAGATVSQEITETLVTTRASAVVSHVVVETLAINKQTTTISHVVVETLVASLNAPAGLRVYAELAGYGAGWTEITADLSDEDINITRGFQSAMPDDLVAAPAVLSFGMYYPAVTGYYSPDSSACRTGWGLRCRVQVVQGVNGNSYTRFVGWVESITPTAGKYTSQTVSVKAASWLNLAASTFASGLSLQTSKRGDQLLAMLVAIPQFPPPGTSFSTGSDTYPYALDDLKAESSYVIDGIDSVAKSGLDRVYEKADGTLVFEPRSLRQFGATNVLTITDAAPNGNPGMAIIGMPITRSRADLFTQFFVTVHPRRIDGTTVILYSYQTSAYATAINPGATITLDGPYQDPLLQAQKVAGFNMISDGAGNLPATDWQITTGPNGAGADISSSCTVSVVFEINKAIFTITNGSGSLGYLSLLQCRGRGVYDYQAVMARAVSSSVSTLGKKTLNVNCPYQADATFAADAAAYLLANWGVERSSLSSGVELFVPASDPQTLDRLLALEISSPIGISESSTGLTAAYWVNGISESYDEAGNAMIRLQLAPRWNTTSSIMWKLEVAGFTELGLTTVLSSAF